MSARTPHSPRNDMCPVCRQPVGPGYVTSMMHGGFRRLHPECKQRLIAEARKKSSARGRKIRSRAL